MTRSSARASILAPIAVLALSCAGCTTYGTQNPLPEATRIPTPDLRGVWLAKVPRDAQNPDDPSEGIIVVNGRPLDAKGCQTVRVQLLDGNGSAGDDWDDRDPYSEDWTWCAHRIGEFTVIEQHPVADAAQPFQHALLSTRGPTVRWCYIDDQLVDFAPPSAQRPDSGMQHILTLSSDELAGLLSTHSSELKRHFRKDCGVELRRVIPQPRR